MKRNKKRSHRRKWRLKALLLLMAVFLVAGGIYCGRLALQIEKRFAGRRWRIPSRVFSDTTLLYPGQTINRSLFFRKLEQLGYHRVHTYPQQPGQLQMHGSVLRIFLHSLKTPTSHRPALIAVIRLRGNRIDTIRNAAKGSRLALLELEPEEIMRFFGPRREQRELIAIEHMPGYLIRAVLAAEDNRFFKHHGVDLRGMLRAFYTDLRHAAIRQGGSTITQQLAKNYFLTPERTVARKLKEILIALIIEQLYGKREILEIYLNEIYFGQKGSVSINGIGEAARFYFGKPAARLSLAEAATLAGLIRAPNAYSPYLHPHRARERRNRVLQAMLKKGWLSHAAYQTAAAQPVRPSGYLAYGKKAPYFIDYLASQLTRLYSPQALASLGLSIYTTLDTQVQTAAEHAVARGLAILEKQHPRLKHRRKNHRLQAALVVMQPGTGAILAMVGGRSYAVSQFNRITQARRQPGSTFKPFVYLAALDRFTPASLISNIPRTYTVRGKPWRPKNFRPMDQQQLTLRRALALSANVATVNLAFQIGLPQIVATAEKFKFSTPLKPYPSLALGAFEVVPLELARAYCTFAANGVEPFPLSLKAVVDEKGNVLKRRYMTVAPVIAPAKAYLMNSLLRSVATEGTARGLSRLGIDFPVAAKTGTTNDFRDAWFVGYTPDLLALVWVGFDNGDPIQATGAAAAMPIWVELFKAIPQHLSHRWFHKPPGVVQRTVCPSGPLPDIIGCAHPVQEVFLEHGAPQPRTPLLDWKRFFGEEKK